MCNRTHLFVALAVALLAPAASHAETPPDLIWHQDTSAGSVADRVGDQTWTGVKLELAALGSLTVGGVVGVGAAVACFWGCSAGMGLALVLGVGVAMTGVGLLVAGMVYLSSALHERWGGRGALAGGALSLLTLVLPVVSLVMFFDVVAILVTSLVAPAALTILTVVANYTAAGQASPQDGDSIFGPSPNIPPPPPMHTFARF